MVVPVTLPEGRVEPSLPIKVFSAGSAACIADGITFPLDLAKVRLQIQGESQSAANAYLKSSVKYRGIFGTIITVVRQEGFFSLYNGLCAGLQRQMCFASIRIGFYDSVKAYYTKTLSKPQEKGKQQNSSVSIRILAGISTGGMSVICAQPTDVVKVRMQAQKSNEPKRYNGAIHAYKTIAKQEGLRGLWKVIYRKRNLEMMA